VYVDDSAAALEPVQGRQPSDQAATSLAERMADVAVITNAVKAGELTIDPEAGEKLLTTLRQQADAAGDWLQKLRGMSRPVPLGTNWVGQAMSGKFERRADGEDVSFVAVLDQYQRTLLQAHGAVDEAMRRYKTTDEDSAAALRRIATTEI
jgi:hypothetical protein